MKNTFKIFGIIVFIAVIGFSFTACPEEVEEFDRDGVVKTITVTGIPTEYIGKYGNIGLGTGSGEIAAIGLGNISGATTSWDLIDAKNTSKGFDGIGMFMVVFWIEESATDDTELFDGYIHRKSITEKTTTIPFGEIVKK
jgi:hypothetical protein